MSGYQDAAQAPKFYYGNAMADLSEILPQENPEDIAEAKRQASLLDSNLDAKLNPQKPISSSTEASLQSIELKLSTVLRLKDEFSYVLKDIQRLLGK